jgi:hypothetical protein
MLIKFIRWGLRLHSVFHIIEFFSAIYESAYITAFIAFISALIQILASVYLPNEHIHTNTFIPDIHENCEETKKVKK